MRRIVLIVALLPPLAAGRPAVAHSCASPVQIEPGRPATVNVGVGAEGDAVVAVDVRVPTGFRLESVGETPGWTASRDGRLVRFAGGPIPPFGCAYFTLRGTATRKATLAFDLRVRAEGGQVQEYTSDRLGDPDAAQLVYAGTEPDFGAGDDGGGVGAAQVVIIGVVAAAGLALAGWTLRSARSPATRPPPARSGRSTATGPGRRGSAPSRPAPRTRRRLRRR